MLSSRFSASTPVPRGGPAEPVEGVFSGVLSADEGLKLGTLLAKDLVTAEITPGLRRLSLFDLKYESCRQTVGIIPTDFSQKGFLFLLNKVMYELPEPHSA